MGMVIDGEIKPGTPYFSISPSVSSGFDSGFGAGFDSGFDSCFGVDVGNSIDIRLYILLKSKYFRQNKNKFFL
jgi:hypothetical protein